MQFIHQGTRFPTLLCLFPSARRAVWNCARCFCRHRPWVSATGLRFTLSLRVMNHPIQGHQFQCMVAMCHAQHLCNEKEKDNLGDPGPMLWLPANPEVHIFTTTAVEADEIKKCRHAKGIYWTHKYTWDYSFFILVPDLALNFYFLQYPLSQQPTNPTQTTKKAMLPNPRWLWRCCLWRWRSSLLPLQLSSSKRYSSKTSIFVQLNWIIQ